MIKDGFYHTEAKGPFGSDSGVALLVGGEFNGGDSYMVYQGKVSESAVATVKAYIYRPGDLNTGKSFYLRAEISSSEEGFVAMGSYEGGAAFTLTAKFIAGPEL